MWRESSSGHDSAAILTTCAAAHRMLDFASASRNHCLTNRRTLSIMRGPARESIWLRQRAEAARHAALSSFARTRVRGRKTPLASLGAHCRCLCESMPRTLVPGCFSGEQVRRCIIQPMAARMASLPLSRPFDKLLISWSTCCWYLRSPIGQFAKN